MAYLSDTLIPLFRIFNYSGLKAWQVVWCRGILAGQGEISWRGLGGPRFLVIGLKVWQLEHQCSQQYIEGAFLAR